MGMRRDEERERDGEGEREGKEGEEEGEGRRIRIPLFKILDPPLHKLGLLWIIV
jgi:hypothetical protein